MTKRLFARRDFLCRGLAGVSVASCCPAFLGRTATTAAETGDPQDDRALVVVQLTGGNDGLSTVVPYSDPAYAAARRTTRITEEDVLRIDDRIGLHPNLRELKEVYENGQFAIVQGTSYPNPTRSHFKAMDIWHSGDLSGSRRGSGWLGRALDATSDRPDPISAINIGGDTSPAMVGEKIKPVAFANADRYRLLGRSSQQKVSQILNADAGVSSQPSRNEQLDYLLRVANDANQSSAVIRQAVRGYRPRVDYPRGNQLASDLYTISAMIAGGLPTKVYYASISGFDTHANQRFAHDNLMTQFSGAISAFIEDLGRQRLLDRVVLLCFTEFGRRVKENGSRGTDHGVAGPMFLFGEHVQGGIHGEHPSLTHLLQGDLKMTVDFRQVYATVLEKWLGISSKAVLDKKYSLVDCIA